MKVIKGLFKPKKTFTPGDYMSEEEKDILDFIRNEINSCTQMESLNKMENVIKFILKKSYYRMKKSEKNK